MNARGLIVFGTLGLALASFAGIHDEPDGVSINMADDGSY